jgi:energy-coupling factor transporter ATP-binding protein EcfA2
MNSIMDQHAAVAEKGAATGAETAVAEGGEIRSGEMFPVPPQPASLRETGLPFAFLLDLTLKVLFNGGQLPLWQISERIRLPIAVLETLLTFMRSEQLCEIARRGVVDADIRYQLTGAGRTRAEAALRRCQYAGPAPVNLDTYTAQIERQSVADMRVTRLAIRGAFAGVVLRESLQEQFGAALNSGHAILIYGPSGSGKTFIAEHLAQVLSGFVHVPHAILVDDEVIQVFDPMVHFPAAESTQHGGLERGPSGDRRWTLCHRPVVMTGGELTLAMLDLQFDKHTRFYVAPPQVKANNGLFIIDDLGRQLVSPHDLMNRWIVPLDRRVDHYALHTGMKFRLPFDVNVIFSSNLQPADLGDDAFLRRLGYKIYVGEITPDEFRQILIEACERARVPCSDQAFDYLLRRHADEQRPLLACTPYDIVSKLRDQADYAGTPPEITVERLAWAWENYFADS